MKIENETKTVTLDAMEIKTIKLALESLLPCPPTYSISVEEHEKLKAIAANLYCTLLQK